MEIPADLTARESSQIAYHHREVPDAAELRNELCRAWRRVQKCWGGVGATHAKKTASLQSAPEPWRYGIHPGCQNCRGTSLLPPFQLALRYEVCPSSFREVKLGLIENKKQFNSLFLLPTMPRYGKLIRP